MVCPSHRSCSLFPSHQSSATVTSKLMQPEQAASTRPKSRLFPSPNEVRPLLFESFLLSQVLSPVLENLYMIPKLMASTSKLLMHLKSPSPRAPSTDKSRGINKNKYPNYPSLNVVCPLPFSLSSFQPLPSSRIGR